MTQKLNSKKIIFIIGLPFAIYLFHIFLFGEWIIDDAGISFTYARNLANGFGLVSQPGVEPVEGYSNFTWVLLFVSFHFFNLFHPVIIPKLLCIILILFSFIILHKTFSLITPNSLRITFICLCLLSLNTSFAIWTSSGLENPLYVFLGVATLYQTVKLSLSLEVKRVMSIAVLTALLAMTRPDGILYFLIPVVFLLINFFFRKDPIKTIAVNLTAYLAVFILIFGSYLLFRFFYFNDIFPNVYYAKGGPLIADLINLLRLNPGMYGKIYHLFNSAIYLWGSFFLIGLIILTAYLVYIKDFSKQHFVLLLMLIFSVAIYALLPADWMGEFRFATLFFPLVYAYSFIIGDRVIKKFNRKKFPKFLLPVILIIILIGPSIKNFVNRTNQFRKEPTVPFSMVANEYGYTFNNYAKILNVEKGSFLVPDVGGTLYYSNLRIYDLAGLIDKIIARAETSEDIRDYVFNVIKPTFIHTHGKWAYKANFDSDERFRRDYIAIREKMKSDLKIYSGDYVRKDIVDDKLELLKQLSKDSGYEIE